MPLLALLSSRNEAFLWLWRLRILSHHSLAKNALIGGRSHSHCFQIQCLLMMPRRQQHKKIWNGKEVVVDCPWVGGAQKSLVSRIIEILSPLSVTPKRAGNIEMNNLRRERGTKKAGRTHKLIFIQRSLPRRVTRITVLLGFCHRKM